MIKHALDYYRARPATFFAEVGALSLLLAAFVALLSIAPAVDATIVGVR